MASLGGICLVIHLEKNHRADNSRVYDEKLSKESQDSYLPAIYVPGFSKTHFIFFCDDRRHVSVNDWLGEVNQSPWDE